MMECVPPTSNITNREKVREYLKIAKAATQHTIANEVPLSVQCVTNRLNAMFASGQVKRLEREEHFAGALAGTRCIYWYLPENEEEVLAFFNQSKKALVKAERE